MKQIWNWLFAKKHLQTKASFANMEQDIVGVDKMVKSTREAFARVREFPEAYQASLNFQRELMEYGIAWHNNFSDECTPDFGCCVPSLGEYKLRIPQEGNK